MSADNGIYIGRFLASGEKNLELSSEKYEYRIIHAQAIENCEYHDGEGEGLPDSIIDATRVSYYSSSPVFHSLEAAWKDAQRLAEKEPVLEYGISEIHYDVPFPSLSDGEAEVIIKEYYDKRDVEAQKERDKEVVVKCLVTKGMFAFEYFVMVQDYPSLTPVVWRGWVDRNFVRINREAGMTDEGYHIGAVRAHKIKEEVREVGYRTTTLQYLIEFPDGIPSCRVWVEPRLVESAW